MANNFNFDIFMNYRRQDSRADAGRIYDRLSAHFGDEHVFMDIDDINPGEDFIRVLEKTLDDCAVLLVLIGDNWVDAENEAGERRLFQQKDFVRLEIQRAIERQVTVIPVLVGGAIMPRRAQLPVEIALLCQHQALEISDSRFHPDVDRLIAELETINGSASPSKKIRPIFRRSLIILSIFGIAIGLYLGIESFLSNQSLQTQVQLHLNVGDKLLEQQDYEEAINEFEKARVFDSESVASYLKLIRANRQWMIHSAFINKSALNIGLRKDYLSHYRPIAAKQISAALNLVYSVQELEPLLKDSPALLLDQALILKASGKRAKDAIAVLEKAKGLAPENAEILAELGLLKVVFLSKPEGINEIERAINITPQKAQYHFYLASSLDEIFLCSYAGKNLPVPGDSERCATAIKEYHLAIKLAAGDDMWSRHIRFHAIRGGLDVFHRYSRKEKDIFTQHLSMSVEERIEQLEFLISLKKGGSRIGWEDEPRYWLAILYESQNQLKKASKMMSQLLEENSYRSVLWMKLQAKLLQNIGDDSEELIKIRRLLQGK